MTTIFKLHEAEKEAANALLSYAYLYDEEDGDTMKELKSMALEYQQARRFKEEAQREARRNADSTYNGEKSKTQQIYEYIVANPGCRTNQIENNLGISGVNIRPAIKWLRIQGTVKPPNRNAWGRYYPAKR